MSNTALTQKAKDLFLDCNRDLLALTKNGPNDVFKRIAAALALDQQLQDDVMGYANYIDQPHEYARGVSRTDFQSEMYTAICKAFLKIQRNGVVEFVSKLTPEAQVQLEDIEIIAGQRAPREVVPPPLPQKSEQELLTEEVVRDWTFLPVDKVKHKFNNKAYKAEFDRLMALDQLDSMCTSLTDGGAEFRR